MPDMTSLVEGTNIHLPRLLLSSRQTKIGVVLCTKMVEIQEGNGESAMSTARLYLQEDGKCYLLCCSEWQ